MDNMANTDLTADVVSCPFEPSNRFFNPAFCNVVITKSSPRGFTSATIFSPAQVRTVAATADVPAEFTYNFDVKPDPSSDAGYVMGAFGTEFGVSTKEARGKNRIPSATNVSCDSATAAGMIARFTKKYACRSGFCL
jgi:hypothetical protein